MEVNAHCCACVLIRSGSKRTLLVVCTYHERNYTHTVVGVYLSWVEKNAHCCWCVLITSGITLTLLWVCTYHERNYTHTVVCVHWSRVEVRAHCCGCLLITSGSKRTLLWVCTYHEWALSYYINAIYSAHIRLWINRLSQNKFFSTINLFSTFSQQKWRFPHIISGQQSCCCLI